MIEKIVLGSKSPRRQELVKLLGLPYEVRLQEVEETYPEDMPLEKVPEYLAELKANALRSGLQHGELLLTCDTVVLLENTLLGKPKNEAEAITMLSQLAGKMHTVISGVWMGTANKNVLFSHTTKVYFNALSSEYINYYVKKYQPLDKAGAYGIQEEIGYLGVQKIEGSYLNVVGIPLADVNERLSYFL